MNRKKLLEAYVFETGTSNTDLVSLPSVKCPGGKKVSKIVKKIHVPRKWDQGVV